MTERGSGIGSNHKAAAARLEALSKRFATSPEGVAFARTDALRAQAEAKRTVSISPRYRAI